MATIVRMTEADIPAFRDCLDSVAREQRFLALHEAPPLEAVRDFVKAGMASGAIQFLAQDEGGVVGWCDIQPAFPQAMRHRGALGMGVLAAHRGRGIGTALIAACIDEARKRRLERIELEVRTDNAAAIALYRRYGFVREGLRRRAMRFDDGMYDAFDMALLL